MEFSKVLKKGETTSPKGKVISFINQKGGVGKTTLAFNTAFALREKGYKVLCMDLDPQANLSLLFGEERGFGDPSVFHLLINSLKGLRPLHSSIVFSDVLTYGPEKNIDLLPSSNDLSGFELTVAGLSIPRQTIVKKYLEKSGILDHYDFIIMDGPPTLGLLVVNILCASHGVLVPFRPDEFSSKGLSHFEDTLINIEEISEGLAPRVLGLVPNMVDLRRKQESLDLDKIKEELQGSSVGDQEERPFAFQETEIPIMDPIFNRAMLGKSQSQKKSVFEMRGKEFNSLKTQFLKMADLALALRN